MFRGCRSGVVAVGFAVVVTLGQAQEAGDQRNEQAQEQQSPARSLPIPFPVEIVEDDAKAEARERSEGEARQREIDDLVTQQGMNAATQAMNEATQKMAADSKQMVWATWVGVALLIGTLLLMWQANRAAVAAVDVTRKIGEAQSRAFMGLNPGGSIEEWEIGADKPLIGFLIFKNYGTTPAYEVSSSGFIATGAALTSTMYAEINKELKHLPATQNGVLIAPGGVKKSMITDGTQVISKGEFDKFVAGEISLYCFGRLTYSDVFGKKRQTWYGLKVTMTTKDGLHIEHLPDYNRAEDYNL